MAAYFRPALLDEALAILAPGKAPPGLSVVAGGTDHYRVRHAPAMTARPPAPALLDITAIAGLAGIGSLPDHWRIGATTRWSTIVQDESLPPLFDGLRMAGRRIGGVQVRNAGTLAGNLCSAAPHGDGIPVLLAMDARLELRDRDGVTTMRLADFILDERRTALRPGQLVTAILVPRPEAAAAVSGFARLAARHAQAEAIVNACAVLHLEGDVIARAGIAVGACAPVARRLDMLEARLRGCPLAPGLGGLVQEGDLRECAPVEDLRGGAAYRREAVLVLLRRILESLSGRPDR